MPSALIGRRNAMTRQKYTISRRTRRRQFVESSLKVPCPRRLQRKMRSNLKLAMRCPVDAHRAARAAEILAEASREPEPVVSPQPVVMQSATPSSQASPSLEKVTRASEHTRGRPPRWSPKSVIKAAVEYAQRVLHQKPVFNWARTFGRRVPA